MTDGSKHPALALRPREAAEALGISARLLFQLTANGQIPCVRLGTGKRRAVLYPIEGLRSVLTSPGQPNGVAPGLTEH